jgi:hypothetical protein
MPFTSEEWDEISQTVPSENEPFIQKYLDGREALIAQENKQRSGLSCHTLYTLSSSLTLPRRLVPQEPIPHSQEGM